MGIPRNKNKVELDIDLTFETPTEETPKESTQDESDIEENNESNEDGIEEQVDSFEDEPMGSTFNDSEVPIEEA